MSGLLRNLLTVLAALLRRGKVPASFLLVSRYWVTPFDTGIRTLKSDKYLQLAESAQFDFMVRTGLMAGTLRRGLRFVNLAQLVWFARPVRLFDRVLVETRVLHADGKCAYFEHAFVVRGERCARVLVKMKFKKGRLTVPPFEVLGEIPGAKPAQLQRWDETLAALAPC